ncbi:hypothetical protein BB560_002704 [Smittium megazygosporum]|uniref:CST complex subunit CTC1 n=1 Tax=Smittium megazygosporum TaxID=133381 RepID=A0A2T9ZE55_9FUNG|nr:hypothetical protein BB560_002704 [Smittium megazygosporum]
MPSSILSQAQDLSIIPLEQLSQTSESFSDNKSVPDTVFRDSLNPNFHPQNHIPSKSLLLGRFRISTGNRLLDLKKPFFENIGALLFEDVSYLLNTSHCNPGQSKSKIFDKCSSQNIDQNASNHNFIRISLSDSRFAKKDFQGLPKPERITDLSSLASLSTDSLTNSKKDNHTSLQFYIINGIIRSLSQVNDTTNFLIEVSTAFNDEDSGLISEQTNNQESVYILLTGTTYIRFHPFLKVGESITIQNVIICTGIDWHGKHNILFRSFDFPKKSRDKELDTLATKIGFPNCHLYSLTPCDQGYNNFPFGVFSTSCTELENHFFAILNQLNLLLASSPRIDGFCLNDDYNSSEAASQSKISVELSSETLFLNDLGCSTFHASVNSRSLSNHSLITYQGVITKIIDLKAGIFILDKEIILFTGDSGCVNPWTPIFENSLVQIDNTHAQIFENNDVYSWEFIKRFTGRSTDSVLVLFCCRKTSLAVLHNELLNVKKTESQPLLFSAFGVSLSQITCRKPTFFQIIIILEFLLKLCEKFQFHDIFQVPDTSKNGEYLKLASQFLKYIAEYYSSYLNIDTQQRLKRKSQTIIVNILEFIEHDLHCQSNFFSFESSFFPETNYEIWKKLKYFFFKDNRVLDNRLIPHNSIDTLQLSDFVEYEIFQNSMLLSSHQAGFEKTILSGILIQDLFGNMFLKDRTLEIPIMITDDSLFLRRNRTLECIWKGKSIQRLGKYSSKKAIFSNSVPHSQVSAPANNYVLSVDPFIGDSAKSVYCWNQFHVFTPLYGNIFASKNFELLETPKETKDIRVVVGMSSAKLLLPRKQNFVSYLSSNIKGPLEQIKFIVIKSSSKFFNGSSKLLLNNQNKNQDIVEFLAIVGTFNLSRAVNEFILEGSISDEKKCLVSMPADVTQLNRLEKNIFYLGNYDAKVEQIKNMEYVYFDKRPSLYKAVHFYRADKIQKKVYLEDSELALGLDAESYLKLFSMTMDFPFELLSKDRNGFLKTISKSVHSYRPNRSCESLEMLLAKLMHKDMLEEYRIDSDLCLFGHTINDVVSVTGIVSGVYSDLEAILEPGNYGQTENVFFGYYDTGLSRKRFVFTKDCIFYEGTTAK